MLKFWAYTQIVAIICNVGWLVKPTLRVKPPSLSPCDLSAFLLFTVQKYKVNKTDLNNTWALVVTKAEWEEGLLIS